MSEQKEMSTEMRSLLAAVLCLVVIVGWSMIYKPPQPPPAKPGTVTTTNPATPAAGAASLGPTSAPPGAAKSAAPAKPVTMRAASAETSIVIESDLYHVEISNRGGVVRSWQLKKFDDDHKPPRTLDLVHPEAAQASADP